MEARRALGLISGRRDGILMVHHFLLLGYKGWADFWATCALVFASQGYVVVAINPTGSTSFGQSELPSSLVCSCAERNMLEFTDGINQNWGGRPIQDLLLGWKYILQEYPEVTPCVPPTRHILTSICAHR